MIDQTSDPFRVSAIFDDGGVYTATLTNMKDAKNRYDMFTSNSQRPPAFAAIFVRKENNMKIVRHCIGGIETVLDDSVQ